MASTLQSTAFLPPWIPLSWPAVAAGIALLAVYLYQWAQPRPLPGMPYNKGIGWAGDVPEIMAIRAKGKGVRYWFGEQAKRHNSPISQVFLRPFGKPAVVISDYREAHDILLRRNKEFDRGNRNGDGFKTVIPNHHITMTSRDPRFRGNKELIKDLMTPAFLNEVSAPSIYDEALRLVDLWARKVNIVEGRPFKAAKDIHDGAMDIILAVAFGDNTERSILKVASQALANGNVTIPSDPKAPVDFPSVEPPADVKALSFVAESLAVAFRNILPLWHHWYLRKTKWRSTFACKKAFITSQIDQAVTRLQASGNDDKSQRCAMDRMILREISLAKKEGRQPEFQTPRMHDELFGYLVGGHDTSSTTLAWIVKFLGDNPAAQSTLRRQLHSAYPLAHQEARQPSYRDILKNTAPYLDAFVEEALRHSGTLPIVSRSALVDTQILGYHIPATTPVIMYTKGPSYTQPGVGVDEGRRSETSRATKDRVGVWDVETMNEFQPERWLARREQSEVEEGEFGDVEFNAQSGPFLAFGAGPRGCFGRRLAYMELRFVTALLVWNFEFLECAPELSGYDALETLTTAPKDCYVQLRKLR